MRRTLHTQNLDETRRVLYIALAAMRGPSGGSAETAGTLANALAHHHRMLSPLEAQNLADEIVSEAPRAEAIQLVEGLIRTITNQLERCSSLEDALGDDETPPWQDTLDIATIETDEGATMNKVDLHAVIAHAHNDFVGRFNPATGTVNEGEPDTRSLDETITDAVWAYVAEAVREWAKENASYFYEDSNEPGEPMTERAAVPLDKFGGDDRHDDGSRRSGRGYDLR